MQIEASDEAVKWQSNRVVYFSFIKCYRLLEIFINFEFWWQNYLHQQQKLFRNYFRGHLDFSQSIEWVIEKNIFCDASECTGEFVTFDIASRCWFKILVSRGILIFA